MKTKIICTIGPASDSEAKIKALIKNGMNIARFNFSHGAHEYHQEKIKLVRSIAKKVGKEVEVLCDLQGPKIRVSDFSDPPIKIRSRQEIILNTGRCDIGKSDKTVEIGIDDKYLHADVSKGDTILVDDGKIELKVVRVRECRIFCRVLNGGDLYPQKGLNLPSTSTTTNSLTAKDKRDIKFILTQKPEYVAISFVQNKDDIMKLRKLLDNPDIKIVSKIERAPAMDHLDDIIEESDMVMVARGDLGVEIPIERLPIMQKRIIKRSNYMAKPVITATQLLDSMTENPYPTRAEATDVANAVLDGTNAVMLSNETAVGKYPIKSIQMLVRIVEETEKFLYKEVFSC